MTLVGIAGCTALFIGGFGLREIPLTTSSLITNGQLFRIMTT